MSEDLNRRVDEALSNMRAPFGPKEASWERLEMRLSQDANSSQRAKSPLKAIIGIAAGLAIAIGLFTALQDEVTMVNTGLSEHQVVTLPDGSKVHMNAESSLSYDEDEFLDSRVLELDGEAFFEVEKGSKFTVMTDQGNVSVLGTSFNIYDRIGHFEVQCKTGKVSVDNGEQAIILTPGLATHSDAQGSLTAAYNTEMERAWRDGVYRFDDVPLALVFDEIERQYDIKVEHPALEQRTFSGEFDSSDLASALTIICSPMGMDYQIGSKNNVTITHNH